MADMGSLYIFNVILSFLIVLSAAFYRKPFYHGFVQVYIIVVLLLAKLKFNPTLESFL